MRTTRLLFTPAKMIPLAVLLLALGALDAPGRVYGALSMGHAFAEGARLEMALLRFGLLGGGAAILALWAVWRAGDGWPWRRALEEDFRVYAAAPPERLTAGDGWLRVGLLLFCLLILVLGVAAIALSGQGGEGYRLTGQTMTLQKRSWDDLKGLLILFGGALLLAGALRYRRLSRWDAWALAMPCFMAFLYVWAAGEAWRWGQYLVGFETPGQLAAVNFQGEMTLHNIGGYWANRAQILYFFLYVTVLPVLAWLFADVRYLADRLMVPVGSLLLAPLGVVGNLFSDSPSFRWLWGTPGLTPSEVRETLFCACILCSSIQAWFAWERRRSG